jgi:predicted RNase H-like nuclease (RuvC/YqgF family)
MSERFRQEIKELKNQLDNNEITVEQFDNKLAALKEWYDEMIFEARMLGEDY